MHDSTRKETICNLFVVVFLGLAVSCPLLTGSSVNVSYWTACTEGVLHAVQLLFTVTCNLIATLPDSSCDWSGEPTRKYEYKTQLTQDMCIR